MTPALGRVLVVRIDKIGDLVLATPAIRNLREAWPPAHITVLVSPQNADVLRGWTGVDELAIYDPSWSVFRKVGVLRALAAGAFDAVIVLSPALDGFLAAFATRAQTRGGVVYSRRIVTRVLSPLLVPSRTIVQIDEALARGDDIPHEVDQTLMALETLGVRTRRLPLELAVDRKDQHWANDLLEQILPARPFAALHLSNLWFARGGSGREMRAMLHDLLDRAPIRSVVVTHGPADERAFGVLRDGFTLDRWPTSDGALVHRAADGRIATVGDVPFGKWAALLAASRLVITRDTGALHVAAALGRPVVAIYEARAFRHCSQQWAPWMVPHRTLRAAPWPDLGPAIVTAAGELVADHRPAAVTAGIA